MLVLVQKNVIPQAGLTAYELERVAIGGVTRRHAGALSVRASLHTATMSPAVRSDDRPAGFAG
jgi:hypothetical protein